MIDVAVSLVEGDLDSEHPFSCFLFLPGIADGQVGAAWETGLCELLTPRDLATIEHFVETVFPRISGTDKYVKLSRFFGISTLFHELTSREHHAEKSPQQLVDILQTGGYFERTQYFDEVGTFFVCPIYTDSREVGMAVGEGWMRDS